MIPPHNHFLGFWIMFKKIGFADTHYFVDVDENTPITYPQVTDILKNMWLPVKVTTDWYINWAYGGSYTLDVNHPPHLNNIPNIKTYYFTHMAGKAIIPGHFEMFQKAFMKHGIGYEIVRHSNLESVIKCEFNPPYILKYVVTGVDGNNDLTLQDCELCFGYDTIVSTRIDAENVTHHLGTHNKFIHEKWHFPVAKITQRSRVDGPVYSHVEGLTITCKNGFPLKVTTDRILKSCWQSKRHKEIPFRELKRMAKETGAVVDFTNLNLFKPATDNQAFIKKVENY